MTEFGLPNILIGAVLVVASIACWRRWFISERGVRWRFDRELSDALFFLDTDVQGRRWIGSSMKVITFMLVYERRSHYHGWALCRTPRGAWCICAFSARLARPVAITTVTPCDESEARRRVFATNPRLYSAMFRTRPEVA